jgi:serine-type D-Ala-D-Ala carboxypeptidase (penicillin-binding protein 5/6)
LQGRLTWALLIAVAAATLLVSLADGSRPPVGASVQDYVSNSGIIPVEISFHTELSAGCDNCSSVQSLSVPDESSLDYKRAIPGFVIDSAAVAVYDAGCGDMLYGKNQDLRLAPASVTKIMTALVAAELVGDRLDQNVSVGVSAAEMARRGSSVMGLEPWMQPTLRDLLYGLMLPSGNDAALALAQSTAGDLGAFVAQMNRKAQELGLSNTHFANPHGLDQQNHYSTASDLVRLGVVMVSQPLLAQIAATPEYRFADIQLRNGNKMLHLYGGTIGVKIGYTGKAKHTIVSAAERDGRRIYISVLGSSVPYNDAIAVMDWAFAQPSPC